MAEIGVGGALIRQAGELFKQRYPGREVGRNLDSHSAFFAGYLAGRRDAADNTVEQLVAKFSPVVQQERAAG